SKRLAARFSTARERWFNHILFSAESQLLVTAVKPSEHFDNHPANEHGFNPPDRQRTGIVVTSGNRFQPRVALSRFGDRRRRVSGRDGRFSLAELVASGFKHGSAQPVGGSDIGLALWSGSFLGSVNGFIRATVCLRRAALFPWPGFPLGVGL